MKTIKGIFLLLAVAVLISCEGPIGPVGPPGEPGENGDAFIGTVIDIQGDFTQSGEYIIAHSFIDDDVVVYESDVVLVYILWDQTEDDNGDPVDIWRLLPQSVVFNNGDILQYNYDHTFFDVEIFLDGTVDFGSLDPSYLQDQVFRIAVLPADYAKSNSLDVSDLSSVMRALKFNPGKIEKFDVTREEPVITE